MHRDRRLVAFVLLLGVASSARAGAVPSPEEHLGYRAGADNHLASWSTVVDYYRKVDDASDRVAVRELGKSTEGRPFLVAVVSSPDTIAHQDRYRHLQRRLTDPRGDAGAEAKAPDPIAESKTVVVITCTIHSSEVASTFMGMELLHGLATKDDPVTREILDKTILLLVPSVNPDGVDIVADWYDESKGHPWEGSGLPRLYHKYAGHDTNRDWFMLNLKETRLLTRLLYKEWFPTILYDVHQMGGKSARLFVPPFHDPINPNLDPRLEQSIFLIGAHMAHELANAGKSGVLTNAMYDNWWNGGNRTTPQRHNIVGVLTEAASARMASPVFLAKDDLKASSRGFREYAPSVNFVDPWPGGWWRLRDIVDYELICARSLLTLAARYKVDFQTNLRAMNRAAIEKGKTEPPFAWVVPADQRDPGSAEALVRILHDSGIEVRRARKPFEAEGQTFPAGSWIFPAAQPYRPHLKDMMERQVYPTRLTAKGEAEAPYDVAGWTLPLQMGVRSVAVAKEFPAEAETVDHIEPIKGGVDGDRKEAKFLALRNRSNDDFIVLNALLEAEVPVFADNERSDPHWLSFPADSKAWAVLDRVLPTVSSRVEAMETAPKGKTRIARPRIGLYQPWDASMDEGWTRLVLEKFHFPYTTLHNDEVRAGDLAERFDTILIPAVDAKTIRNGYAANETAPKYVGGLGKEGAAALREFLRTGKTLVCLEESCEYAIDEFGLPVKNVLKDLKSSEFYSPGSIFRATSASEFDTVTAGVPEELSVYFDQSLAFDSKDGTVRFPVRYAATNPLESGWLLGPEKVQGKGAVAVVPHAGGEVILFGFPPQHRGQPHGTFRLLFNALLTR